MNKVTADKFIRMHPQLLHEMIGLNNTNVENYMRALTTSYGIVAYKLAGGEISNDLKCTAVDDLTLLINSGYAITLESGEIIIATVPESSFSVSGFTINTSYYVYIVPKKTSYEAGTLSFTNGAREVSITGGSFAKLGYEESISIDTSSNPDNNGLFQVASIISNQSVRLVNNFPGVTESGLKWKIVGYYSRNSSIISADKTSYSYDSYEVVISSNPALAGFKIAKVDINGSGTISGITDLREQNLYKVKPLIDTNADNVLKGITKDITTIEEKYQAKILPDYHKDSVTKGVTTGLAFTLNANAGTLTMTSGSARDGYGRMIIISAMIFNLQDLVTQAKIIEGENYLHVLYTGNGTYTFLWLPNISNDPNVIVLGNLKYLADIVPPFPSFTDEKRLTKFKSSSIITTGKGKDSYEGELYYKPISLGNGKYAYQRKDKNGVLEEQILVNENYLNSTIDTKIGALAKIERLRFALYVNADRQGWFMHNGIALPAWIGYKFKVLGFHVLQFSSAAVSVNELDTDYIGTVLDKVLPKNATPEQTEYVALDSANEFDANKLLGVWFKKDSPRAIQLVVNGNVLNKEATMGSDSGPDTTTKFYIVEVAVQALTSLAVQIELPEA